jgi:hypothetical protein
VRGRYPARGLRQRLPPRGRWRTTGGGSALLQKAKVAVVTGAIGTGPQY